MEQIQQILQEGGEEPPPGVRRGPVQVRVSLGGGRSSSPHLKRVPSGSLVCTSEGWLTRSLLGQHAETGAGPKRHQEAQSRRRGSRHGEEASNPEGVGKAEG